MIDTFCKKVSKRIENESYSLYTIYRVYRIEIEKKGNFK